MSDTDPHILKKVRIEKDLKSVCFFMNTFSSSFAFVTFSVFMFKKKHKITAEDEGL